MSERIVETYYEDRDFKVVLELIDSILFLHCYVHKYNKSVKKRMEEVFDVLTETAYLNGWDAIHAYTTNYKFAKMWPGCFKIDEFYLEGKTYEVLRWELQQEH